MEHWQRTIEAGNRYFAEGSWVEAREQYLQALALAQVLFERWRDADAAVAALVVSQHNLADLQLMLGHPEEAAEHLCACHEHLLRSMANQRLAPALRQAALNHSRRTYTSLLNFIAEHGAYPRTDRLLGVDSPGDASPVARAASAVRQYH
ncbi:hypothetical protein [Phytopseudomonas dryadis]|uniref:Tetratricopeptide repeat protein n=1 Tax=Phytopseudomonas dryadis TaxID=2487520 RepID=A0ABY1Z8J6_9GAMM|nr:MULTISPECIES: hypothetical protein [Pseudomonas]TBV04095.1 hypothetical protein DNK34_15245 [Pseudomonas dryadis]TBV17013.1 hypothetical protein DNK41_14165 [Pseudomonas sp. FRB 230]